MVSQSAQSIRSVLNRGKNADRYCVEIEYRDSAGVRTRRVVSPIRVHKKVVLALCLCRELPRNFTIAGITAAKLVAANDVLMPATIETISEGKIDEQ